MGQDLMSWMAPAGSLFEEMGIAARDRSQATVAREASAGQARPSRLGSIVGTVASFMAGDRLLRAETRIADCCSVA